MKTPVKILFAAFVLFLLAPAAALADRHGERGERDHGRHMERVAERLELTEAQKVEWKAIHEAHHPRMRELRQEIRVERRALREASDDQAARDRLDELMAEVSAEREQMHAQIREILTEEQQARLEEIHAQRAERRTRGGDPHPKRQDGYAEKDKGEKKHGDKEKGKKKRSGRDY